MLNRAMLIAGSFLALFALAGCLIIPTDYYASYSRENIAEEPPAGIVMGAATREGVLLRLGEPDGASQDETELWYHAAKIKAIVILGDRGGEIIRNYFHVIRFDKNGLAETLGLYNNLNQFAPSYAFSSEPHFSKPSITLPTKTK